MRAHDEVRQLFCMGLRSASIWCFPKYVKTLHVNKHLQKLFVFKRARQKQKTPEASLQRRKLGLGVPIHIKMTLILMNLLSLFINMHSYALLVLGGSIVLPLFCYFLGWIADCPVFIVIRALVPQVHSCALWQQPSRRKQVYSTQWDSTYEIAKYTTI